MGSGQEPLSGRGHRADPPSRRHRPSAPRPGRGQRTDPPSRRHRPSAPRPGRGRRTTGALAACLLATGALTACTGSGQLKPQWHQVQLPADGRATVRALTSCSGRWYAVGAVTRPGGTGPAAWVSTDTGRHWSPVPVQPTHAYGPTQTLTAAACTASRLVAVGGVAGGVHGNLRISTWLAVSGGPLTELGAPFERYGGPEQEDVGRVAAGRHGFVIEGDRAPHGVPGAAAWASPDGSSFTLIDALSPGTTGTAAADVTALPDGGWLLVGSVMRAGRGGRRDPLAWRSADGLRWRPADPPDGGTHDESFDRVTVAGSRVIAAGVRGDSFGAWWATATDLSGWHAAASFDRLGSLEPPSVVSLAATASGVLAAVDNGSAYRLWLAPDSGTWSADRPRWRPVITPVVLPAGSGHHLAVAASDTIVLAATDDGTVTRLWRTDLATPH